MNYPFNHIKIKDSSPKNENSSQTHKIFVYLQIKNEDISMKSESFLTLSKTDTEQKKLLF